VSAEHFQSLNIDHRGEMVSLLTGFQPRKFPQLVSISLGLLSDEEIGIDVFFEFLQRCPQLESPTIHYVYLTSNDPLPSRLHPNIIPRLCNLTVPLLLIDVFMPNRPVGTVSVKRGYPYDHVAIGTSIRRPVACVRSPKNLYHICLNNLRLDANCRLNRCLI
jgi:hypothetical protein